MNKKRRVAQHKQKLRKAALKAKARELRLAETGGKATPAPARTRYEIEDTPAGAVKETRAKAAAKPAARKKTEAAVEEAAPAKKPAARAKTETATKPKATIAKAGTEAAAEEKPKKTVKKEDAE